jgi:hypothetical protein
VQFFGQTLALGNGLTTERRLPCMAVPASIPRLHGQSTGQRERQTKHKEGCDARLVYGQVYSSETEGLMTLHILYSTSDPFVSGRIPLQCHRRDFSRRPVPARNYRPSTCRAHRTGSFIWTSREPSIRGMVSRASACPPKRRAGSLLTRRTSPTHRHHTTSKRRLSEVVAVAFPR